MAVGSQTVDNHKDIGANVTSTDSTGNSQMMKDSCFVFNRKNCTKRETNELIRVCRCRC